MKRIHIVDSLRGFTIISMVLFHLLYNINFYETINWYNGTLINKIWQFSIAFSFFLISGISSNFLKDLANLKRGVKTSILGFLISLVTYFFAKDQLIIWGVLNGLGLSMILGSFLNKYFKMPIKLSIIFLIIFIFTYKIPMGSLYNLFAKLYDSNLFILGFPSSNFSSSDYFPILPWIFAYFLGMTFGKFLLANDFFTYKGKENFLTKIGKHSLAIYLLHQIILYPLVTILMK